jgi:hypothetical protein
VVERQSFNAGDLDRLSPRAGMAVGAGDHQTMQHGQVNGALDIEAEAAGGQVPAQHLLAADLAPEMAEHQIGTDAATAELGQFAAIEAGQHDRTPGMLRGGGDQAVQQVGVLDRVAPAERLDDALDMPAALAGVLDQVEILVAADSLDADEHGCCLGCDRDTMPNPAMLSSGQHLPAKDRCRLAPHRVAGAENTAEFRGSLVGIGCQVSKLGQAARQHS